MELPKEWASEPFCYITTTGRRTGRPHTIESDWTRSALIVALDPD